MKPKQKAKRTVCAVRGHSWLYFALLYGAPVAWRKCGRCSIDRIIRP